MIDNNRKCKCGHPTESHDGATGLCLEGGDDHGWCGCKEYLPSEES